MLFLLAQWPFWVVNLLIVFFLAISVVMLLTILIQKPQGGGLSAAFGSGASSGQTAFGAKTGDALTIFTIIIFALYVVFAIVLNWGTKIDKGDDANPAIVDPSGTAPTGGTPTETPAPAGTPAATPSAETPAVPAPVTPAPEGGQPAGTPAVDPNAPKAPEPQPPQTGPGR
jgi:preprotein translocase subunit SecG